MRKVRELGNYIAAGIAQIKDIILILIGAGAIGGVIEASDLPAQLMHLLENIGAPSMLLAPITGFVMAAATASTSTGVILASSTFGDALLKTGINPLAAAVTMQTGAVVANHLPHGNFFLISARSLHMTMGQRLHAVGWESLIGAVMAASSLVVFAFMGQL